MEKIDIRKLEMGIRFRIFREIMGLTSLDLANQLEVSEEIVKEYENGLVFPDVQVINYMYEHYGLNVNWLVGRVGQMFNDKAPEELKKLFSSNPFAWNNPNRFDDLIELFELMEIPAFQESIMATLQELKTSLVNQAFPATADLKI